MRYHQTIWSFPLQNVKGHSGACPYKATPSFNKIFFGAAVAEWLSSWLAEQEDRGSIPRLATWIFRDWLSPASKSRYGWKIAKSTLIKKQQPTNKIFYWSCDLVTELDRFTEFGIITEFRRGFQRRFSWMRLAIRELLLVETPVPLGHTCVLMLRPESHKLVMFRDREFRTSPVLLFCLKHWVCDDLH